MAQEIAVDGIYDPCAPLERLDIVTGVSTPLPRFGDCPELPSVAGPLLASASADGILVVRAFRVYELVAKLKSLTNLRAVREAKSATGWSIELGPFPGWRNIPAW